MSVRVTVAGFAATVEGALPGEAEQVHAAALGGVGDRTVPGADQHTHPGDGRGVTVRGLPGPGEHPAEGTDRGHAGVRVPHGGPAAYWRTTGLSSSSHRSTAGTRAGLDVTPLPPRVGAGQPGVASRPPGQEQGPGLGDTGIPFPPDPITRRGHVSRVEQAHARCLPTWPASGSTQTLAIWVM